MQGKGSVKDQVSIKEMNANEPLKKHRESVNLSKVGLSCEPRQTITDTCSAGYRADVVKEA